MRVDFASSLRVEFREAMGYHIDLHQLAVLSRWVRIEALTSELSEEAMVRLRRKWLGANIRRVDQARNLLRLHSFFISMSSAIILTGMAMCFTLLVICPATMISIAG